MILDRDIWVDRTLTTLAEPHSEGSFLLARKGGFMHDDRAKALGLIHVESVVNDKIPPTNTTTPSMDSTTSEQITKQAKKPVHKAFRTYENKMIQSSENKGFDDNDEDSDGMLTIELEPLDDLE